MPLEIRIVKLFTNFMSRTTHKKIKMQLPTIKKHQKFLQFQSFSSQFRNANIVSTFILKFFCTQKQQIVQLTVQQHCDVREEREPFSSQKTGGSFFQGPHGIRGVAWNVQMIFESNTRELVYTCDNCSNFGPYAEDIQCLLQCHTHTWRSVVLDQTWIINDKAASLGNWPCWE